MESSGVPGKMQISQATFELVCDDEAFAWDERGFVHVKGKGDMKTYLLRGGEWEGEGVKGGGTSL